MKLKTIIPALLLAATTVNAGQTRPDAVCARQFSKNPIYQVNRGYPPMFAHANWICCQTPNGLEWQTKYQPIPKCQADMTAQERERAERHNWGLQLTPVPGGQYAD